MRCSGNCRQCTRLSRQVERSRSSLRMQGSRSAPCRPPNVERARGGEPMSLNLALTLRESARIHPERTALVAGPNTFSYAALDEQARRFAGALAGLGVEPGDRVALMLPNIPHFTIAYFGTLYAGAIVGPAQRTAHRTGGGIPSRRFTLTGAGGMGGFPPARPGRVHRVGRLGPSRCRLGGRAAGARSQGARRLLLCSGVPRQCKTCRQPHQTTRR